MNFIWIIIISFVVYSITMRNFFIWKTIVTKLWKNIFKQINYLAEKDNFVDTDDLEKSIRLEGDIINSILKYINYHERKKVERKQYNDYEDETFGYGYFDFDKVLMEINREKEDLKNQKGQS